MRTSLPSFTTCECDKTLLRSMIARQINLIDQMIEQRVSALVVAPADSKAIVPVCKKALDAGIVVVNIDNKLDADALKEKGVAIPFVGPDNRKGARLAGEHLLVLFHLGQVGRQGAPDGTTQRGRPDLDRNAGGAGGATPPDRRVPGR